MKSSAPRLFVAAGRVLSLAGTFAVISFANFSAQAGAPVINVFTSIGTANDSPSAGAYDTNTLNQISSRNGGSPSPAGSGSASYSVTNSVFSNQVIFSSDPPNTQYNSWLGSANPGTTYGPAYANEFGNLLRFGLDVVGDGTTKFSLSQLNVSTYIDQAVFDTFTGANFAPGTFRLFAFDINNVLQDVTAGSNSSTLVDRIVYRGVGSGCAALAPLVG